MNNRMDCPAVIRPWAILATVALICLAGMRPAHAQRFEALFGSTTCVEAGRGGVQKVSSGGYVAAGNSYSTSSTCASSDVYVVRTRNDGLLGWSMLYDIGLNDSATSIREVTNDPNGVGGFIVTGVTDNRPSTPTLCLPSRDIFILRIDSCGRVLWVRTYGVSTTDEIAWDVIEATTGDTTQGTQRGDFVVAGWRNISATSAVRDAYLLRVRGGTAGGAIIWDRTYDSPFNGDDYFYALDECVVNVGTGATADIVAVGSTNGYKLTPTNPDYDAFLVRVNGNNGTFTALATHSAVAYGGSGNEELRSVTELRAGTRRGNIVAVGQTSSVGGGGEAYVLQTAANVCSFVADRTLGDFCGGADAALWVREIPVLLSSADTVTPIPLVPSSIIVTGYVTPPAGFGFGGNDVFLQEFTTGTLNPVVPTTTIYGGAGNDWGWSVNYVTATTGCTTTGFIISGFRQSSTAADDPGQLYLIKTDRSKSTTCQRGWIAATAQPQLLPICNVPRLDSIRRFCTPPITRVCRVWQERICYISDGTGTCRLPLCPLCAIIDTVDTFRIPDELGKNIPATSGGTISMYNGVMDTYPNPIHKGGDFILEYALDTDRPVFITVSDLAGRRVYSGSGPDREGISLVPVSTEGWPVGTYTVTMNVGGTMMSRKIVVKE